MYYRVLLHISSLSFEVEYAGTATSKLTFYCFHGNTAKLGDGGSLEKFVSIFHIGFWGIRWPTMCTSVLKSG